MRNRGRIKYVPPCILDEINNIKKEEGIPRHKGDDTKAMQKMVEYSCLGREIKKVRDKFFLRDILGKK